MIELTKDNFNKEVVQASQLVLVDYWGPSCIRCVSILPKVIELGNKYADKVKFCSVDTSKNRRLAIEHRVMGLPTVVLYRDGRIIELLVQSEVTIENIEKLLKQY